MRPLNLELKMILLPINQHLYNHIFEAKAEFLLGSARWGDQAFEPCLLSLQYIKDTFENYTWGMYFVTSLCVHFSPSFVLH